MWKTSARSDTVWTNFWRSFIHSLFFGMTEYEDRFGDQLPFSFEEMVDDESWINLFEKFKDCERVKMNEDLVFERAFDKAFKTGKKELKYMAKFIGNFGRLPDVGMRIKKIFKEIYTMEVLDEFYEPNITDVHTSYPLAEDFGFLAVFLYMEDVFSNGDIEKLFNDLAAISTTDTAITILHLRIIFMMILYLPKKYQRCVRKEWIPIFLEQFDDIFDYEVDLFGQITFLETERKNPHIEEYKYIFDTVIAYFKELAKTEPCAEAIENLQKEGVARYMKYRWAYVEYMTLDEGIDVQKYWVENHELYRQIEEMKKAVRERKGDENELRRLKETLEARARELRNNADALHHTYGQIRGMEECVKRREKVFIKTIADLAETVAEPMDQNVQGTSSQ